MLNKTLFLSVLSILSFNICSAQYSKTTAELFSVQNTSQGEGKLVIVQDPGIDSLINRYILYNLRMNGMEGFRIQIYNSSNKNAREESGKIRAEFISKFPDIISYASFERPGYYKIRVGDFRTRIEAIKYLLIVSRVFPEAYLVPDIINFPDQIKN